MTYPFPIFTQIAARTDWIGCPCGWAVRNDNTDAVVPDCTLSQRGAHEKAMVFGDQNAARAFARQTRDKGGDMSERPEDLRVREMPR